MPDNKPQFKIHRRREGFSWVLCASSGKILAHSATPFTERRSAIKAIKNIKVTVAEAEIQKVMGDRPGWSNTL